MERLLLDISDWHTLDRLQAVIGPEGVFLHWRRRRPTLERRARRRRVKVSTVSGGAAQGRSRRSSGSPQLPSQKSRTLSRDE